MIEDTARIALLALYSAPGAFAFFAAWWAQERGRNPYLWFAFGLLLMPIAGLALLMLNRDRPASEQAPGADGLLSGCGERP